MILWLDDPATTTQRAGGKGGGLAELTRAGFPVPPGFVIDTQGYERFSQQNELGAMADAVLTTPDLRVPAVARQAVAAIQERLLNATLPVDLKAAIGAAYADLRGRGVSVVAARSSALSEDAASASSAGLYETCLNLRDEAALREGVLACYRSLWSARAVQYRAIKGLESRRDAMAVVVMQLVPATVAGVAFTAHPISGDRDQIFINASWGLGEAVVSGEVTPDSFTLARADLRVMSREIYEKQLEFVPDPTGASGTVRRPVTGGRAQEPALADDQLRELGALCRAIAEHFGQPMDIEWAFAAEQLMILQARPITRLS